MKFYFSGNIKADNYMANAAGRLIGMLTSGLTYQIGGLSLMLAIAAGMVALSAIAVSFLKPEEETMG